MSSPSKPLYDTVRPVNQIQKFPSFNFNGEPHLYPQFRMRFLEYCEEQKYDEEVTKLALKKCMQGLAAQRSSPLLSDCSFLSLLVKYDTIFSTMTPCLAARIALEDIHQNLEETLREFHQRIFQLWIIGYPNWTTDGKLVDKFVEGILSPNLRFFLRKTLFITFTGILELAENRQAKIVQESNALTGNHIPPSSHVQRGIILQRRCDPLASKRLRALTKLHVLDQDTGYQLSELHASVENKWDLNPCNPDILENTSTPSGAPAICSTDYNLQGTSKSFL